MCPVPLSLHGSRQTCVWNGRNFLQEEIFIFSTSKAFWWPDWEPGLTLQVSSELFCAKHSLKESGVFSKDGEMKRADRKKRDGPAWWPMPVTTKLRRLRQDSGEAQAGLRYIEWCCFKQISRQNNEEKKGRGRR